MEGDAVYFGRRAAEERAAAVNAPHPGAQRAHLEMAERYEDIAAAIASGVAMIKLVTPTAERSARR